MMRRRFFARISYLWIFLFPFFLLSCQDRFQVKPSTDPVEAYKAVQDKYRDPVHALSEALRKVDERLPALNSDDALVARLSSDTTWRAAKALTPPLKLADSVREPNWLLLSKAELTGGKREFNFSGGNSNYHYLKSVDHDPAQFVGGMNSAAEVEENLSVLNLSSIPYAFVYETVASLEAERLDKKTYQGGFLAVRLWLFDLRTTEPVRSTLIIAGSDPTMEVEENKRTSRDDFEYRSKGDLQTNLGSQVLLWISRSVEPTSR